MFDRKKLADKELQFYKRELLIKAIESLNQNKSKKGE
jgi:hypothetical protein